MSVEAYLAALERRLPWMGRRRILAEVRAHLLDAASRHESTGLPRAEAEEAATRDFGDMATVASSFCSEVAVKETRLASALALAAVPVFVLPLYVVPENTLPPATWAEKPVGIELLQVISISLWATAAALAVAGSAVAWTRWSRIAASLLEGALGLLAASILVSVLLVAHWAVSASVAVLWPLLAGPLALACLASCAEAVGWTHSRRCRLVQD